MQKTAKKFLSMLLALMMVLSILPTAVFATEQGTVAAPLDSIVPYGANDQTTGTATISVQNSVTFTGYSAFENVPYYLVTVPAGTTYVKATYKDAAILTNATSGVASGYYADVPQWTGGGVEMAYTESGGDITITIPLNYSRTAEDGTTVQKSFVLGADGSGTAYAPEYDGSASYAPVHFLAFTYDPAALTLNTTSNAAANLTVEDNNGTVRVRRYGATQALGEALALDFTANKAASSTVTLTNAKFDLDANSINFDAPDATISDADTVVNANNFTVTLPDAFTSDETRLVPNGGSFTFKPVDSHYTYTFTVKMGDTVTEGLTFGANDTYTIGNISGNVEVTCTGKTPKQYDVKYKIDEDVEQDVTKGPETVTYLNDYSFAVTPRAGYSYRVIYSVDNGDPFVHTVIAVPTANDDGTLTYTIPGKEIVGGVEIWIDPNTESGIPVVFTGNGVEDAASGNASSMGKNMPYYFTLNQRESCDYTVTAYYQPLATPTASKRPATVRSLGNGKYVVEAVNYNDYLYVYAHSWNLVVKVEKVSHSAEEVTVSKYLELNDKTMMLVTVKGTPEGGKAFTYDGNTMYKVNAYGTDQYAWLVIVDKGQTLTQEEAAAKVAISAADNVVTITLGFDVNMTGKVDVNDAQLVYDMYNGTYSDFTQVSVEKFLRADVNATKAVDHTDAVAIVNQFK